MMPAFRHKNDSGSFCDRMRRAKSLTLFMEPKSRVSSSTFPGLQPWAISEACIFFIASKPRSFDRHAITTWAPWAYRARLTSRPTPAFAPVTMHSLPDRAAYCGRKTLSFLPKALRQMFLLALSSSSAKPVMWTPAKEVQSLTPLRPEGEDVILFLCPCLWRDPVGKDQQGEPAPPRGVLRATATTCDSLDQELRCLASSVGLSS
mmetsp:Transcript_7599/g.21652  ORF Transcript_7599/g.21652 Transcript_7599/m.21652 type:complete len:205 (-) Transcript_7599:252-866(-)